jgi:hypothetical protein
MTMQPVESSNISAIGHDPATSTLRVEFLNGGTHEYDGVSAEAHEAFAGAESKGIHFHENIRGYYPHRKVV